MANQWEWGGAVHLTNYLNDIDRRLRTFPVHEDLGDTTSERGHDSPRIICTLRSPEPPGTFQEDGA